MRHAGSTLDYISFVNDSNRLSPFLVIACSFRYQTARMGMPVQLCTGIIGCDSNTGIERTVLNVQLIQPNISCVIFDGG